MKLLAEQFARADASLRELQARADRAGGPRLPRATCADMLAGRRFPKKAVMVAFLRACRVPEQQLPAWERAWERVRIARMPAMAGLYRTTTARSNGTTEPTAPQPGPPVEPTAPPPGSTAGPTAPQPRSAIQPTAAVGPTVPHTLPAIGPIAPAVERTEPAVGQVSPEVERTTRAVEQAAPVLSPVPPAIEQAVRATERVAPVVEQAPPAVERVERGVGQAAPAAEQAAPSVKRAVPVVEPVVEQTAPAVERAVPGVERGGRGFGRWRGRRVALLVGLPAVAVVVAVGAWHALQPRTVTDDGRAFGRGGSSRFTVKVDPANTGVRLIRRLDANVPLQRASISVNGVPAGEWKPLLGGTYGWLDQSVDIPPALTTGRSSLTVVNTFVSSVWDFNEFRYVVKQKINGVWSTADVVDIGPDHTGSEAEHDYRITGQTFRGHRTFDYPPSGESAE
ncbi:hypothetical protein GCM10023259_029140 [Thermocatellispora tengchongensis]